MRTVLLTGVALVLAAVVAASGFAQSRAPARALENGVALLGGAGTVTANVRGALIGTLASGRIVITDVPDGAVTDILVVGGDQRSIGRNTTIVTGEKLRFRIFRGRWRIRIQGTGIDASIVGTGTVELSALASGPPQGRYSFAGDPYTSWPVEPLTLRLGD